MNAAKKIEVTSDVTRFRGVLLAAMLAAVVVAGVSVASTSPARLRGAPGPLSDSHRTAGLSCDACHGESNTTETSCDGCHEKHDALRTAHAELLSTGALSCATCHPAHGDHDVVTLLPNGEVTRSVRGMQVTIASSPGYRPSGAVRVPIPSAGACAGCHDPSEPGDPIIACLAVGQESMDMARPALCLDEHSRIGGSRDAAWEAARRAVLAAPVATLGNPDRRSAWSWVGGGWLVGFVVLGATRKRARRDRSKTHKEPALKAPTLRRLPIIDTTTCLGCHACVDTCPFDVLEVRNYIAVVARPAACCGLTLCEQRCPNGSLVMGDGTEAENPMPLDEGLQSEVAPGVYLAGDVTGLPLIRNAINQGAHAVRALHRSLGSGRGKGAGELDLIIVGAGPAGISAALEAKSLGLRYQVLEQTSVAGSIRSFPRDKLVFDQPLDLPLVGQLWLEESTKEELLSQWLRVIRSEALAILEGVRVADIAPRNGEGFIVEACDENGTMTRYETRRVLLAVGKRGTPRKLPIEIPASMEARVFHSLADARSVGGRRLVVVGLGDVAMEAAIALSRQPDTKVVVVHRGDDFGRGQRRNIVELQRRVEAGAIDLRFESSVSRIEDGRVVIASRGHETTLPCDGLFVLIGSIPLTKFLARAGVLPSEAKKENER